MDPKPRDVDIPLEISSSLQNERVDWNDQVIYLDGRVDEHLTELKNHKILTTFLSHAISPSGRYVAYSTLQQIVLWDTHIDEKRILVYKERDFPNALSMDSPVFSKDERYLVFSVTLQSGSSEAQIPLVELDLETGKTKVLWEAQGDFPEISPDGRWILYNCWATQLCLYDRESEENRQLTEVLTETGELSGWYFGSFSADGRYIVYDHSLNVGGPVSLYRMNLDGSEQKELVYDVSSRSNIVYLTTQDEVAFGCQDPDELACSWVCIINLDGTDVRRLMYLGKNCLAENNKQ